jgi:hypothetical protein
MKSCLLFTILFFSIVSVAQKKTLIYNAEIHSIKNSPGEMVLDIKKDFGAVGNGKENLTNNKTSTVDHDAFENAANFINSRGGYVRLRIPLGIFIVGKQIFNEGKLNHYNKFGFGENASFDGYDVLLLMNTTHVTIEGITNKKGLKPVVKYRKALKLGLFTNGFDKTSNPETFDSKQRIYLDKTHSQRAHPGDCFKFLDCTFLNLSNISIDGNCSNFSLGGRYGRGKNPFENYHSGIYLINVRNVLVTNMVVENMALDGIVIKDVNNSKKFSQHIIVSNCIIRNNGRNGLSWLGGSSVSILNTQFYGMGTQKISTEPCAGIDIESETLYDENIPSNGIFKNCVVRDNDWLGLAAGAAVLDSKVMPSKNMLFDSCNFIGSRNSIADIESDGYVFTNCNFYGQIYLRNSSNPSIYAAKFNNCLFTNQYKTKKMMGEFLVISNESKKCSFTACQFTSYNKRIFLMDNAHVVCGKYEDYPMFKKCIFSSYIDTINDSWFKTAGLGSKTAFEKNTFYYSTGYPFFTDTYSGNMCAQDLGGNSYYLLSREKVKAEWLRNR